MQPFAMRQTLEVWNKLTFSTSAHPMIFLSSKVTYAHWCRYYSNGTVTWDAHRIGWLVAGMCYSWYILETEFIHIDFRHHDSSHHLIIDREYYNAHLQSVYSPPSTITYSLRFTDYFRPLEQRQIIRILLMPPVYATISFFSYRYFRDYTYYFLAEAVYEALAIAAFLMLLIQYQSVVESTAERKKSLTSKSERNVPFPFCCWRYSPSKHYFMHTLKVSEQSAPLTVDASSWLFFR